MRPNKPGGLPNSVLVGVSVYALLVPLPANGYFNNTLRLEVYNRRPYILVILAVFLWVRLRSDGRQLSPHSLRLARMASLTPVFFAIDMLAKHRPDVPTLGIYVSWAFVAFWVAPLMLRTLDELRQVVLATTMPFAVVLMYVYIQHSLGATSYIATYFKGIDSLGFQNPDYLAQLVQVLVVASFLLTTIRAIQGNHLARLGRFGATVGFLAALYYFVTVTQSRSALIYLVGVAIFYLIMRERSASGFFIALTYTPPAVFMLAILIGFNNKALNTLSSNRITVWQESLEDLRHDPTGVMAWLFGQTTELQSHSLRYDPLTTAKSFDTFHVDNAYLEKLITIGLLGLVLFAIPYVVLMNYGSRLSRDPARRSLFVVSAALFLGVTIESLTTTTIPTFAAPVGYVFAFLGVLPGLIPEMDFGHRSAVLDDLDTVDGLGTRSRSRVRSPSRPGVIPDQ